MESINILRIHAPVVLGIMTTVSQSSKTFLALTVSPSTERVSPFFKVSDAAESKSSTVASSPSAYSHTRPPNRPILPVFICFFSLYIVFVLDMLLYIFGRYKRFCSFWLLIGLISAMSMYNTFLVYFKCFKAEHQVFHFPSELLGFLDFHFDAHAYSRHTKLI